MRAWVVAVAVGCGGATGTAPAPTSGDTGSSAVPDPCVDATTTAWSATCDGGVWSGLLTANGCLRTAAVDVWSPVHHERHALVRVDRFEGQDSWALGPVLAGAAREAWAPGSASVFACEEHPELTIAVWARSDSGVVSCEATGPDAAAVADLPGSPRDWGDCP